MFLSFTQVLPHGHPDVDNKAFPPLEFEGLVVIQASSATAHCLHFEFFPWGNPSLTSGPCTRATYMASTEGEKDLNQGERVMKKTDTFNLQAGDQGTLLFPSAGRSWDMISFQPALLWAEVMRSLGKSFHILGSLINTP